MPLIPVAQLPAILKPSPGSCASRAGWHQYSFARYSSRRWSIAAGGVNGLQGALEELREDPVLRGILDSPRIKGAIQEFQTDQARALQKYAGDAEVMRVITKLAEAAMKELQAASQAQGDGSLAGLPGAAAVAATMFGDKELAAALGRPRIRAALAEIRANPLAAMAKYENDEEVMGVLDALQARLEQQQGGGDARQATIDV